MNKTHQPTCKTCSSQANQFLLLSCGIEGRDIKRIYNRNRREIETAGPEDFHNDFSLKQLRKVGSCWWWQLCGLVGHVCWISCICFYLQSQYNAATRILSYVPIIIILPQSCDGGVVFYVILFLLLCCDVMCQQDCMSCTRVDMI